MDVEIFQLKEKIEIPIDDVTKIIIQGNHGDWDESLQKQNPICFSLANNTYDDDRMSSEMSVEELEALGYALINISTEIKERILKLKNSGAKEAWLKF